MGGAPGCDAGLGGDCCAGDTCGVTKGLTCKAGKCECSIGATDCDGEPSNGCEATLATDSKNCGACGHDCQGGICAAGACQPRILVPAAQLGTLQASGSSAAGRHLHVVDSGHFYWFSTDGRLARWPLAGGAPEPLSEPGQKFVHPPIPAGDSVFWIEEPAQGALLRQVPKTGGNAATVKTYMGGVSSFQLTGGGDVIFLESSGGFTVYRVKSGTTIVDTALASAAAAGVNAYFFTDGASAWMPGYPQVGFVQVPFSTGLGVNIDTTVKSVSGAGGPGVSEPRAFVTDADAWLSNAESPSTTGSTILRCPKTVGPCKGFAGATTDGTLAAPSDILADGANVYVLTKLALVQLTVSTGEAKRLYDFSFKPLLPIMQQDAKSLYFFNDAGDFVRLAK